MKAIQATERGDYGASSLMDIPQPEPQAGRTFVRATSAAVTWLDSTFLADPDVGELCDDVWTHPSALMTVAMFGQRRVPARE